MKHSKCCHQIDSQNTTFNANHWIMGKAKRGFLAWFRMRINGFRKSLVRTLMLDPEPYISEHQNRKGEFYYRVYDPDQDIHHTFDSEESVRIWLEERHYR